MTKSALPLALLAAAFLAPGTAHAKAPWVKKAQELGFKEIQNCKSCHADKMPGLNELGQWLVDEKTKRNAAEVDLAWLKDYPKKS